MMICGFTRIFFTNFVLIGLRFSLCIHSLSKLTTWCRFQRI